MLSYSHTLNHQRNSYQKQFWVHDLAQGHFNMQPELGIKPPTYLLISEQPSLEPQPL